MCLFQFDISRTLQEFPQSATGCMDIGATSGYLPQCGRWKPYGITLMLQVETREPIPITAATALDRLLVVDDDSANIHSLELMLGKLGFEIIPAVNGEEALRLLAERPPDLILLKGTLSGMNAFELCKRVLENALWTDVPIIFYSENEDKDLLVRALEGGGADYLAQPFNKAELLSRIRTHLMLKTTRDHLKQLAREKDDLLHMISHYLQNNLVGMNMSARLLLDRTEKNSDPKLRLMAENICSSSNSLHVFIRSLLANAAADREFKIHFESVDFNACVRRAMRQYQDSAHDKEITLEADLLKDVTFVHADPIALEQVLDNLISNAVKFSPPKKKITAIMQRNDTHVECCVRDEGPGFTEHDKARMFHRYARLSARPTRGEPSTGLGLSIAMRLIRGMHGDLVCESTHGEGAAFTLRLPISFSNS